MIIKVYKKGHCIETYNFRNNSVPKIIVFLHTDYQPNLLLKIKYGFKFAIHESYAPHLEI